MARLFDLFRCYWSVVQKKNNGDITSISYFVVTSLILSNLKKEWVFQRVYNLDDLKKIAYTIDCSLDELDPMRCTHKPELYMSKLIEFKNKN